MKSEIFNDHDLIHQINTLVHQGDYLKAWDILSKKDGETGADSGVCTMMGMLLNDTAFHLNAPDLRLQAREFFLQALEMNPREGMAYYLLGMSYLDDHSYNKAISCFQNAIDYNTQDLHRVYLALGQAYYGNYDMEEAEQSYSKAIETKSDYALAWKHRGYLRVNRGIDGGHEDLATFERLQQEGC